MMLAFANKCLTLMTAVATGALRRLGGAGNGPVNRFLFAGHGLRYRKLEVILTKSVEKLGKAGDTVKVASGHFRNHLMPKLLAVPNIPKFQLLMQEQRQLYQRSEEEGIIETSKTDDATRQQEDKMKEYQTAAKRLGDAKLRLRRHIKVDNELSEPVTKNEIISEVKRQLFINIHPDNLHLLTPLTSLGEYELPLRLPRDIPRPEGKLQWTLRIKIRRK